MTTLEDKQVFFAGCVARFVFDLKTKGILVTFGEAFRSPETCSLYAKEGKGITASLHQLRLAVDLNFWQNDKLVSTTEEIANLWENYSTGIFQCCAGFHFTTRRDSDHFSVSHNGIR